MQPDYSYTPYPQSQPSLARVPRRLWVLTGVLIAVLIGWLVWHNLQFHVVSTTPAMNNVPAITPYVTFHFNQPLADARSASVGSLPNIVSSFKTDGKTLVVNLANNLTVGQPYTLTLKNITSAAGQHIVDKTFSFTAQDVPFDQLSQDQQQAILKTQTNRPYTKEAITFIGLDSLVSQGMSTNQAESLKQAFFNYSQTIHKQFGQITIDTTTLRNKPIDRNHPSLTYTIYFDVAIDGDKYSATVDETGLSTARLYLYNPTTKTLVYDSKNIDFAGLDSSTNQ